MNKIEYWHEGLSNLLDKFVKEVKEGKYEKYPYNCWRDLKKWTDCNRGGCLELADEAYDVILYVENLGGYRQRFGFDRTDNSLGSFLFNELCEADLRQSFKREYKSMQVPIGHAAVDLATVKADLSAISDSSYGSDTGLTINKEDITFKTASVSGSFTEMATGLQAVSNSVDTLVKEMNKIKDKEIFEERKESKGMFGLNFDFGSCEHDNVKMSMYGLAVKNASGEWVSYDKASKSIINVDILNFDGGKYLYKMPVALKDVKAGDIILHARKPMFVSEVVKDKIIAADPFAGEEKIVLPTKNCFGFDFATKIVNFFDGMTGGASAAAPFGNMLPLLMMGDGKDIDPMVMMMAMGGQMDMSNPMMMYALMSKDGKANDILPFLMMGMNGGCGCHCDCDREG